MLATTKENDFLILPESSRTYKKRGIVTWVGGKASHLGWLLPLIPYSDIYIEPFGGSAAVLLHRNPSKVEIYNDLDQNLVNLFRVFQHPKKIKQLLHRLNFTMYSREELRLACKICKHPNDYNEVEKAWSFYTKMELIQSGLSQRDETAWSQISGKSKDIRSKHPLRWESLKRQICAMRERLASVYIESYNATKLIKKFDRPDAVIYCDPPYMHETRKTNTLYSHEMGKDQHIELLQTLLASKAAIVLSGYDCKLYQDMLLSWYVVKKETRCSTGINKKHRQNMRTEVVWRNARAMKLSSDCLF